jgi:hypothetical protein
MGKRVTYNFGKPIDLNATVAEIRQSNVDEVEARRLITEKIQEAMFVSIRNHDEVREFNQLLGNFHSFVQVKS